jgi:hypothetical protein
VASAAGVSRSTGRKTLVTYIRPYRTFHRHPDTDETPMNDKIKGKAVFWLPEGPMLRVERKVQADPRYEYVLHIMDLNPEQHTRWALSRKNLLVIGWGLIRAAFRRS